MNDHLIRPSAGPGPVLEVTPRSAGWDYLDFKVVRLDAGGTIAEDSGGREVAIVPLSGSIEIAVDGEPYVLARSRVFTEMPSILYVPPGSTISVAATTTAEFTIGGAPAEGRYPTRLFAPTEMRVEIRGGANATRQVNHVLAHPLPAERLILYEVYVPRGGWSGWPPHCHDGFADSPYLEEVYYFRLDPDDGWAVHRNYRIDTDFDEVLLARDGDVALVTQGFHSSIACPTSNMWFLNYLAGTPEDDERKTPPFFQENFRWIEEDWGAGAMDLPTVAP